VTHVPASSGPGSASDNLPLVERALPIAHSLLWNPIGSSGGMPDPEAYPLFITRRAVEAVNAHAPPSTSGGVFGFLAGDLCHCPRTGVEYLTVDLLIGLSQPIYGDKATVLMNHVWHGLQQQLAGVKRHLLGWYHSHPPLGLMLTPGDVEAHFAYFPLPWHVALVVDQGHYGPEAGFYRPTADVPIPILPLPFYEIIDPPSGNAETQFRSFVIWDNYEVHRAARTVWTPDQARAVTAPPAPPAPPTPPAPVTRAAPAAAPPHAKSVHRAPAVAAPAAAAPVRSPPPPVTGAPPPPAPPPPPPAPQVPPAQWHPAWSPPSTREDAAREDDERPSVRTPLPRHSRIRVVAAVLSVGALLFVGRALLGPRATSLELAPASAPRLDTVPAAPVAPPVSTLPLSERPESAPPSPLVALSDSLTKDLQAFQSSAALFSARCRSLADGLVAVEQRWLAYSVLRKKLGRRLDPARAAADSAFNSAMDSVEASYERSKCPRP
jgi:proteasome lid subunit RPN8/RPN11